MPFNLDALVNQTVEEPNATQIVPCPIGDWTGRIAELRPHTDVTSWIREVNTKNGPALTAKVPFEILTESVQQQLGRKNVIASMDLWLDVDAAGRLLTGEGVNVNLGRLREALGLNAGSFNLAMLPGRGPLKVKVDHESSKDDPKVKYAKVVLVAPL